MAIINSGNITASFILQQAITLLKQHRDILNQLNNYYSWSSGLVLADLTGAPFNLDSATAQGVLNAIADAHNEYVNHSVGLPAVSGVTSPPTGYRYGDSQNALIGPAL